MQLIHDLYTKLIKNFSFNKVKHLFIIFFLSPIIIFIVLIRPIIFIRFGNLNCERIGNSVFDAELYLLFNKFKKKKIKSFDIWVLGEYLCNQQLLVILKRKFFISQHLLVFYNALKILSKYFNVCSKHIIIQPKYNAETKYLFDKHPCQLALTKREIDEGELILKKFGIPENAKIVCITCRDSLYLKKNYPKLDFSYHKYRDGNIKNYIPAIKSLISKNFYVVRMGKIAKEKINIKSDKFIDYPFHPLKSDFMDFFFAHKCHFWIGNNMGLDEVAKVFRKPLILTNMSPLSILRMHTKKILIFLRIFKNSNNQKLSMSKIFDYGIANLTRDEQFKKKKIKLIEVNSNEYKKIILEVLKIMKDSWKIKNKRDLALQKRFRKLFSKKINEFNFLQLQGKFKSIYSPYFLRKNQWFLK